MAQCFELLVSPVSVPTSFLGNTVYPVITDVANCMTVSAQNPYGATVAGHFIGLTSTEYQTLFQGDSFDWQAVYDAFGMSLLMFATGLGVGLLYNIVRKFRI
ncbi:hypothetical protein B0F88_1055 [Methylobacter tundripaludum]|uniref:Uncharacterized protein n=1 Tax=Methylobacter tundripaludum TaxID=173365 RepID=A0A2S6H365_9GAMM|nr:hypothetical protein [Methylobacter tundripaludum]PPK71893.1 hypothetical protein B0F88_1055 [Methylobacter tundripaludum]